MFLFEEQSRTFDEVSDVKDYARERGLNLTYAIINTMGRIAPLKHELEGWYQELSDYLDREYPEQAMKNFHQRIWELYCGRLLNKRFKLIKKSSKPGLPDFLFESGESIWLEATAPDNGSEESGNKLLLLREVLAKNGHAEYGGPINERTDPVVVRMKAAIEKKYQNNFPGYLKNGMREDQPFILAINSYLFDDGMHPEQVILQLFFEMGNQVVIFGDDSKNKEDGRILRENRKEAASLKGDKVSVGIFRSDKYKYISGVIYSTKDIYNLERGDQEIGKDVYYIGNPNAKNPIPVDIFSFCTRVVAVGEGVKLERPS